MTHVRKFFRFDPRTGKKKEFFARFQSKKNPSKNKIDDSSVHCEEYFLSSNGGETIIEIASKTGKELAKGVSICSEEDAYVKSIGIKKATALALNQINSQKDLYKTIRKAFFAKE